MAEGHIGDNLDVTNSPCLWPQITVLKKGKFFMSKRLKSIELFAGAAGLGLAAKKSGIDPLAVVVWNKDCRNTFALNRDMKNGALKAWPKIIGRDVRDENYSKFEGKIDIVTGGPPSQQFSMGGKHRAHADNRKRS